MKKIIDIAQWNGNIDFAKLKGVDGAIIKVINKSNNIEKKFEQNYKGAKSIMLPVGVYNYSYATNTALAQAAASATLKALAKRPLDMGVWLDIEDEVLPKSHTLVDIINAYAKVIIENGYQFGVYTGLSFYNSYLKKYKNELPYQFWIARYPSKARMLITDMPNESKKPDIANMLYGWQYTSKGAVSGINGNVDMSIVYDADMKPDAPEQPPVNKEMPILRKGSKGEHVTAWQTLLSIQGYYKGNIDGIFGPQMLLAVKAYQKANNLADDGVIGAKTWATV